MVVSIYKGFYQQLSKQKTLHGGGDNQQDW